MRTSTLTGLALAAVFLGACSSSASIASIGDADAPPPAVAPLALIPVPLPAPRHGHRIERVNGGLLSFGGFGDASTPDRETRQTWWLAPGERRWQRRAEMRRERAFFASAVVDGTVYAIGDSLERYDFAADRWEEILPPGSFPTSHFCAAAVGSTLYVLGGVASGGPEAMRVFDTASATLRDTPAPPSYRRGDHFHFMVALGGRVHVIGGLDGESFRPRAEHWMLEGETWKALPAPLDGLWAKFAAQAVIGDELYLFGDFGAWCFDARAGAWTPRAKLPLMLVMPQAVVTSASVWVIGGMPVEGPRERLLLRHDLASDQWFDCSETDGAVSAGARND